MDVKFITFTEYTHIYAVGFHNSGALLFNREHSIMGFKDLIHHSGGFYHGCPLTNQAMQAHASDPFKKGDPQIIAKKPTSLIKFG